MKWAATCLFVFFAYSSNSQESSSLDYSIDSLKKNTQSNLPDTTKIKAYYAWDELIYLSDINLDLEINQEIVDISERNLDRNNITLSEYKYYYQCRLRSYNVIGLILIEFGDLENSLFYLEHSLKYAKVINDTSSMSNAYNNLGMLFRLQERHEKSIEYYEKSYQIDSTDDWSTAIYLNNVGLGLDDLGEHDKALK